jgi:GntR family transcriptional regulator, transcriptional repressor for pyruvate dehydrogenase complex
MAIMKKIQKSSLPNVRPDRLVDHLAKQLMARTEKMALGEKLPTESELAKQFEVSRSVVREAVSQLKSLGTVETRQGAGMFVSRSKLDSLRFRNFDHGNLPAVVKILEIRSGLDAAAARIAAVRRTEKQLEHLRELCLRSSDRSLGIKDEVEADSAFHMGIVEATQNDYFVNLETFIAGYLRQGVLFTRQLESYSAVMVDEVNREHMAILNAIAAKKPAEASRRAERHVKNGLRRIRHVLSHLIPDIA